MYVSYRGDVGGGIGARGWRLPDTVLLWSNLIISNTALVNSKLGCKLQVMLLDVGQRNALKFHMFGKWWPRSAGVFGMLAKPPQHHVLFQLRRFHQVRSCISAGLYTWISPVNIGTNKKQTMCNAMCPPPCTWFGLRHICLRMLSVE